MFAKIDEAHAEAKAKATVLSRGELGVLHLNQPEAEAYQRATEIIVVGRRSATLNAVTLVLPS